MLTLLARSWKASKAPLSQAEFLSSLPSEELKKEIPYWPFSLAAFLSSSVYKIDADSCPIARNIVTGTI